MSSFSNNYADETLLRAKEVARMGRPAVSDLEFLHQWLRITRLANPGFRRTKGIIFTEDHSDLVSLMEQGAENRLEKWLSLIGLKLTWVSELVSQV
jgi:hypothetical protein